MRAYRTAVDDGFGCRLQDFEAIEGFEDVGAGDQDSVVLEERGGAARREGVGDRAGVRELQAEGDAADFADDDVAFRNGAAIEREAGDAESGSVDRVGIDDGADL